MLISEAALKDVAAALGDPDGADPVYLAKAADVFHAAVPHIRKAERERLREIIDPAKLDLLATWFDQYDRMMGIRASNPEVQRDLRLWAMILRGEPTPEGISEVLATAAGSPGLGAGE